MPLYAGPSILLRRSPSNFQGVLNGWCLGVRKKPIFSLQDLWRLWVCRYGTIVGWFWFAKLIPKLQLPSTPIDPLHRWMEYLPSPRKYVKFHMCKKAQQNSTCDFVYYPNRVQRATFGTCWQVRYVNPSIGTRVLHWNNLPLFLFLTCLLHGISMLHNPSWRHVPARSIIWRMQSFGASRLCWIHLPKCIQVNSGNHSWQDLLQEWQSWWQDTDT